MPSSERSYERITIKDLKRLRDLALKDLKDFFRRHPRYKPYEDTLLLVALCQGAALHYIDLRTGVKDFDVYSFFAEIPSIVFPYRRRKRVESSLKKFGVHPKGGYKSRLVDLFIKTIKTRIVERNKGDPRSCITEHLKEAKTPIQRDLAKKAVIGLYPDTILGKILYSKNKAKRAESCAM